MYNIYIYICVCVLYTHTHTHTYNIHIGERADSSADTLLKLKIEERFTAEFLSLGGGGDEEWKYFELKSSRMARAPDARAYYDKKVCVCVCVYVYIYNIHIHVYADIYIIYIHV